MRAPLGWIPVLSLLVLVGSCTDEPTEPPLDVEVSFLVVSGDAQVAVPGEELSEPLVVQAVDERGKGLRNQHVNFRIVAGGGSMWAGASITDREGYARDYWTLGLAGNQRVEVRAVEPTTGEKQVFAEFTAFLDGDEDGFGSNVDCDDQNPATYPGAEELPDNEDNDCDGEVDEGLAGSEEVCDGIDNDLDGQTDEDLAYCIDGLPAPNTDGESCDAGWVDANEDPTDGCEAAVSSLGHLVLNEVDYAQDGIDSREFVEIYNPTDLAINLDDFEVRVVNHDGTSNSIAVLSGTLGPHGFAVIGHEAVVVPSDIPFFVLATNLQNGPDAVALLDASDVLVDAVAYGEPLDGLEAYVEGTPLPPTTVDGGDGESLIRYPDGTDTDDAASDWTVSSAPSPGAPNVP